MKTLFTTLFVTFALLSFSQSDRDFQFFVRKDANGDSAVFKIQTAVKIKIILYDNFQFKGQQECTGEIHITMYNMREKQAHYCYDKSIKTLTIYYQNKNLEVKCDNAVKVL